MVCGGALFLHALISLQADRYLASVLGLTLFLQPYPVVDELLPTAPNGRLICATTVKQAQLWPALLEKAYMKLMGGYDFPGS